MTTLDDFVFELCISDKWTDITADVYADPEVTIERGRTSGTGQAAPSTCKFAIDNTNGKYSPRNPVGPYYSSLGRNQPIRVARKVAVDTFTRAASSSWGTADAGGAWTNSGGSASDFSVSSGAGNHLISAASSTRLSYLAGQVYGDVDVSAAVSLGFSNVTGGSVEPGNVVVGGVSTSDYFFANVKVSAAEAITVSINHASGSVLSAIVTLGFTYTGQGLAVRLQQEGQNLRAKVWPSSSMEPYAWTVECRTNLLVNRAKGWVGIRSGVGAGNTNVPVTFSYDNLQVRSNRFAGEVANWPATWDLNGGESLIQIEAAGIRRRVGQGEPQLKSPYRRGNETITPAHVAYWPVEEGSEATQIASGIGGASMGLVAGKTTFATSSDFPGSANIAVPNACRWVGVPPKNSATGQIQMVYLLSIPSTGEVDQATLSQIQTTGSAAFIDCFYQAGGGLKLSFYGPDRVSFHTSGNMVFALNGKPVQLSVELTQNGSNVDYTCAILEPGATLGIASGGTAPSCTIGAINGVFVNAYRQATSSAIGHVALRNSITSIYTLSNQLKAYWEEAANDRVARLCTENGVPSQYLWDGTNAGVPMGIQKQSGLLSLLDECADADQGSLHESRCALGLVHRVHSSLYNQTPALTLDFNADRIIPPLQPAEDDQEIRNDVTVTREDGSSYQAVQTSGPLGITDPSNSRGVGRYATGVTLNLAYDSQTVDAAGWMLNLGTTDEPRYPGLRIGLAPMALSSTQQKLFDALALNLDDRITIANGPFVDPGLVSQIVRGYTERLDGIEHTLELNCNPESPYQVAVVNSAALGKVDTDTSILAGGVTSTATSILVRDPLGSWTTDPAEMPIPITVGGEGMTVSAVTALGPSFVAAGTAAFGNNASVVPGLPAGLAEGDAMLCLTAIRSSPTGAPNMPADWTLLAFAPGFCLWGKIAVAAELAPTVTFADGVVNATTVAQIAAFRGCSINLVGAASQVNGSAQNIAYPALAIGAQRSVVIIAGWKQDDWTSVATLAGATEIGEPSSTIGDDTGIVWDYMIQPFSSPADISAGSFTVTGGAAAISRGMVVELDGNAQLMSVTRSVNGVVKAQTVGTQVSLTRRSILAL